MGWSRPLGALVALAALAGCGDDEGDRKAARSPASLSAQRATAGEADRAGSVASLADCRDWRRASRDERFAIIEDIRGQATPQRSASAASPLSDERAYRVFERACAANPAGRLRLSKIYIRVQAFTPLSE